MRRILPWLVGIAIVLAFVQWRSTSAKLHATAERALANAAAASATADSAIRVAATLDSVAQAAQADAARYRAIATRAGIRETTARTRLDSLDALTDALTDAANAVAVDTGRALAVCREGIGAAREALAACAERASAESTRAERHDSAARSQELRADTATFAKYQSDTAAIRIREALDINIKQQSRDRLKWWGKIGLAFVIGWAAK